MVRTLCFHFQGPGSNPDWGTKILLAVQHSKKKKKKKEIEGRGAANLAESEEPELTSLHRHTKTTTIYIDSIDG